jgi:DNA-binding CsgD family transcriptional regulator
MAYPGYSDVIAAIYQTAIRPELWAGTLELVADYLGADSGMVLHMSASGDGNFIIHRRLREDLNRLFLQHYTKNPYAFAFARAPIGKALVTEALVEKAVLYRSAFYADILAPQGITDIIAVKHAGLSRDGVGGILFNVSKTRTNDAELAATRLDHLASHLVRAVDLTLLASRLSASHRQLDRLLASMGALVVLDCHGCILQMSPSAETLLSERDGLRINKGGRGHLTLRAQARDDSARLATGIKQALAVARGEPQKLASTLQIRRPSGRRALLIQIMPLPASDVSPWIAADGGARAMVQIVDPQASVNAQAERLRVLAGLTAAEARVAELLGSGLGATEAASALGVSLNTVKTHARRVFDKAGVRSSAALARLVMSMPVGF